MTLRLGSGHPLSVRLRLTPSPTRRTRPFCRFATFPPVQRRNLPPKEEAVNVRLFRFIGRVYLGRGSVKGNSFTFFPKKRIQKQKRFNCKKYGYLPVAVNIRIFLFSTFSALFGFLSATLFVVLYRRFNRFFSKYRAVNFLRW